MTELVITTQDQLKDLMEMTVNNAVSNALSTAFSTLKQPNEIEFMTVDQVCEFLQISKPTLWRYVKDGKMRYYQTVGKKALFKRDEVINSVKEIIV